MDELLAMEIMQQENPSPEEIAKTNLKKSRERLALSIIKITAAIIFVIWFIFNVLIHPLDMIKIRLQLLGSCHVTMSIPGTDISESFDVDGNVLYMDEKYYEFTVNGVYVYTKGYRDKWIKQPYEFDLNDDDMNAFNILLDKNNYKRNWFKWKTFKLNEGIEPYDLSNINTRVSFGTCIIRGHINNIGGYYVMEIKIEKIGKINLTLPKVK